MSLTTRTDRPRVRAWLPGSPRWTAIPELRDLSDWLERDGMRMEVVHEGDTTVHRLEVPGVDPERDVQVELDDGWLVVTAERRDTRAVDGDGPARSEFHYGSFSRRVTVPAGLTPDDVTATYRDGILEVRVTSADGSGGARRVPVQRG